MNTTKNEVFIKLQHENLFSCGRCTFAGGRIKMWFRRDFSCRMGISKFLAGQEGRHPSLPSTH